MKVYEIRTTYNECNNYDSYTVLAATAESAIKKIKPKLIKGESVDEVKMLTRVDYE